MTGRKKLMIGAGGALVLVVLIALNASRGEGATSVRLEEVEHRSLVSTVTASGQIEPTRAQRRDCHR